MKWIVSEIDPCLVLCSVNFIVFSKHYKLQEKEKDDRRRRWTNKASANQESTSQKRKRVNKSNTWVSEVWKW